MYFCSIYIPYFFNLCTVCTYPMLFFLSSRHMSVEFLQILFVYFLSTSISLLHSCSPPFLLSFKTTKQQRYISPPQCDSLEGFYVRAKSLQSKLLRLRRSHSDIYLLRRSAHPPEDFYVMGNCVSHYKKTTSIPDKRNHRRFRFVYL